MIFSYKLPRNKKLLITLVKSLKNRYKRIHLIILQVSSLQFYLKWIVSHIFLKFVPRFTHFVDHLYLAASVSKLIVKKINKNILMATMLLYLLIYTKLINTGNFYNILFRTLFKSKQLGQRFFVQMFWSKRF